MLKDLKVGYRVIIQETSDSKPWPFTVRSTELEALEDLKNHNEYVNKGNQRPFLYGKIEKIFYRR